MKCKFSILLIIFMVFNSNFLKPFILKNETGNNVSFSFYPFWEIEGRKMKGRYTYYQKKLQPGKEIKKELKEKHNFLYMTISAGIKEKDIWTEFSTEGK